MQRFLAIFFLLFLNLSFLNANQKSLDTIKSYDELTNKIYFLLNQKNIQNSKTSISIYSLKNKKYIYNYNQDELLVPASVTKLFTTFFALNLLHNDPNLKTSIYTDAKEIKPILNGNLYIYGKGDALLSLSDLDYLIEKIKSLGIKKITGNVYADGSFFDGQTSRFSYSGDLDEVEYVPPITALSINRNSGMVIVSAGSIAGRPASIQIIPASLGFVVNNSVRVVGAVPSKINRKNKKFTHNFNNFDDVCFEQKYGDKRRRSFLKKPGISITTKLLPNGKQLINLSGSISINSNLKYSLKILNPVMIAAGAFYQRLKDNGIEINGTFSVKKIDFDNSILITEFSRSLCDYISELNKNSDNYLAETLFKTIGATFNHTSNNKTSSVAFYKSLALKFGIDTNDILFNDGSGLSRRNKTTTKAITQLLIAAAHSDFADCFGRSLAIAGVDGTLRKRFISTYCENNLIAKTGTHKNVSALAGFVNSLDGDTLVFAIVSNGWAIGEYKILENTIGEFLSLLYIN